MRLPQLPSNGLRLSLAVALVVALAGGCDDGLRKASELGVEPQVLTVRVTPPEAAPGETATFDALVHWPSGDPAYLWLLCQPSFGGPAGCVGPDLGQVTPPACEADPSAPLCVLGATPTVQYTVPDSAAADGPQTLTAVMVAADGPDALPECLASFAGDGPGVGCEMVLKRLVVSRDAERNANPELLHITVGGEPTTSGTDFEVARGDEPADKLKVDLGVQVDVDTVDELTTDEPVDLVSQWFTTCGSVDPEKQFVSCQPGSGGSEASCEVPQVTWKPGLVGTCQVHVVVRDGRGGTGFLTQSVRIQ